MSEEWITANIDTLYLANSGKKCDLKRLQKQIIQRGSSAILHEDKQSKI